MLAQTRVTGVAFSPPVGGRVAIPPDGDVAVPGPIRQLPRGVAFGPLAVRPERSHVGIDRLAFPLWRGDAERDYGGAGGLAGGAVAATAFADDEFDPDVTTDRRRFLAGAGLALGGAVLGAEALDAGDVRPHLELELVDNPGGVSLGLVEALATDGRTVRTHEVRLDGDRLGTLQGGSATGTRVPPGRTGRVTLHASRP